MKKIPEIRPGDLVKVYSKIIEGNKERITPFQGVVIQIRGSDVSKTFTVRKISAGVGIERIFPLHSPMITKIEVKKKGKVRRAKLTYLRSKKGKHLKIKDAGAVEEVIPEEPAEKPEARAEKPVVLEVKKQEEKKPKEKAVEPAPGAKTVEKV